MSHPLLDEGLIALIKINEQLGLFSFQNNIFPSNPQTKHMALILHTNH